MKATLEIAVVLGALLLAIACLLREQQSPTPLPSSLPAPPASQPQAERLGGEAQRTSVAAPGRPAHWSLVVLDHETRRRIPSFAFMLYPEEGGDDLKATDLPRGLGREGALELETQARYSARLVLRAEGYLPFAGRFLVTPGGSETIELQPATATITGKVVDVVSKEPVASARIWVAAAEDGALLRHGLLEHVSVGAGADGWFTLRAVVPTPEQPLRLEVYHADYCRESLTVTALDEPVVVELRHGPRIHGTVWDEAGRPAAGQTVVVSAPGVPLVTDASGEYRSCALEPGGHNVTVYLRSIAGEPVLVMRGAVVDREDVRVDFGGEAQPVHGEIRMRNGSSPAGCRVLFRAGNGTEMVAAVDSGGRFAVSLPVRPVWATSVARGRDWIYYVEPAPLRLPRTEPLLLLVPGATIRGVVATADGLPITGRRIAVEDVTAMVGHMQRIVRTDDHGRFQIGSLEPGRHVLRVAEPTLVALDQPPVEVAADQVVDGVRLEVRGCSTLSVRLPGVGRWDPSARVVLRGQEVLPGQLDVGVGENEFRWSFPRIPPGEHELEVRLGASGIERRRVSLREGEEQQIEVRVDAGAGRIEGKLAPLRGLVGCAVWTTPSHCDPSKDYRLRRYAAVDGFGRYEIPCLDDGLWNVHVRAAGREAPCTQVQVTGGTIARLDLSVPTR